MARKRIVQNRRTHILQAADSLFERFGYEKTTMEDFSQAVGIPRATIYLEFPGGKVDILMAYVQHAMGGTLEHMRAIIRKSKDGRLETLRQVILFNLLSAHEKSQPFNLETITRYNAQVSAHMGDFIRDRNGLIQQLLDQAILTGELPAHYDTARITTLIVHGMHAFLPPNHQRFTRESLQRDAGEFFAVLLSGLKKSRSPSLCPA